ncbi:MAG: ribosome maturation factor RimM [Deltaproteobacteria bacterium]|nr:ribosome maturation factor RimM [Deltaproteobacteria bacterium]
MSIQQIALGDIAGTHGVAGWVRVRLFNPEGRTLYSSAQVELTRGESRLTVDLEQAKPHRGFALVKLRGIDDMDAARNMVGYRLSVPAERLAPLGSSEYYYAEVVGFEVRDAGGGRVGTVTRIWAKQGGDLLVVAGAEREHLVPAIPEVVRHIDVVEGTITIDPPDGLLDL